MYCSCEAKNLEEAVDHNSRENFLDYMCLQNRAQATIWELYPVWALRAWTNNIVTPYLWSVIFTEWTIPENQWMNIISIKTKQAGRQAGTVLYSV